MFKFFKWLFKKEDILDIEYDNLIAESNEDLIKYLENGNTGESPITKKMGNDILIILLTRHERQLDRVRKQYEEPILRASRIPNCLSCSQRYEQNSLHEVAHILTHRIDELEKKKGQ